MFHRFAAITAAVLLSLAPTPHLAEIGRVAESDPGMAMLIDEQTLFELTNADRADSGLPNLQFEPELLPMARDRATSQLGTHNLSHFDGNGQLVLIQMLHTAHIEFTLAGENLARSRTDRKETAGHIEVALMNSPLHRKNILEQDFNRVAIGAATNAQGQITFAEIFLGSSTPTPPVANHSWSS